MNVPKKLDSKTSCLRITVPENLDLVLEGLIRKVLREQPQTDDIYSFAADYFEALLKIREKSGWKVAEGQSGSFRNEDAHEMVKLANAFPKPPEKLLVPLPFGKTERKLKRKVPSTEGKSGPAEVKSRREKVGLVSQPTPDLIKKLPVLTRGEEGEVFGNPVEDLEEDEEFLKSDPIKELVERELEGEAKEKTEVVVPAEKQNEAGKEAPENEPPAVIDAVIPRGGEEKEENEVKVEKDVPEVRTVIDKQEDRREKELGEEKEKTKDVKASEESTESTEAPKAIEPTEQSKVLEAKESTETPNTKAAVESTETPEIKAAAEPTKTPNTITAAETTETLETKGVAELTETLDTKAPTESIEAPDTKAPTESIEAPDTKAPTESIEAPDTKAPTESTETPEIKETKELTEQEAKDEKLMKTEEPKPTESAAESPKTEKEEETTANLTTKTPVEQTIDITSADVHPEQTAEETLKETEKQSEREETTQDLSVQKTKEIETQNEQKTEGVQTGDKQTEDKPSEPPDEIKDTAEDTIIKATIEETVQETPTDTATLKTETEQPVPTEERNAEATEKDLTVTEPKEIEESNQKESAIVLEEETPQLSKEIKDEEKEKKDEKIPENETKEQEQPTLEESPTEEVQNPEVLKETSVEESPKESQEIQVSETEEKPVPGTTETQKISAVDIKDEEDTRNHESQTLVQSKEVESKVDRNEPESKEPLSENLPTTEEQVIHSSEEEENKNNKKETKTEEDKKDKKETKSEEENEKNKEPNIQGGKKKEEEEKPEEDKTENEEGTKPSEPEPEKQTELKENQTEKEAEPPNEDELCTVVDSQELMRINAVEKIRVTEEDPPREEPPTEEKQIKTIETHYYDLLQVPETVTKEYKVHHTADSMVSAAGSLVRTYQLVQGVPPAEKGPSPDVAKMDELLSAGRSDRRESETPDEFQDLMTPTSGYSLNLSEMSIQTVSEMFLDSEKQYSSLEKEEIKFTTQGGEKPEEDDRRKEVEEVIEKTVLPSAVAAVPIPPREVEEINAETNLQEVKKEDNKPEESSSDDSAERSRSNNSGSIDSDTPIISVEVKTVIETQVLDDEEEDNGKMAAEGVPEVEVTVSATIDLPEDAVRLEDKTKERPETNEEQPEGGPARGSSSSIGAEGSSGESDSTISSAATEIKRSDSAKRKLAFSESSRSLLTTQSLDYEKRSTFLKTRSLSTIRNEVTDSEVWNTIEKELEQAAIKIQSKYRGYTTRKRLRREDAVQITTEESSSVTPTEVEVREEGQRGTGEFHDSIILSEHPR